MPKRVDEPLVEAEEKAPKKKRERAHDALTDPKLRNLKPEEKPYKLVDGSGLYLLVTPAGGMLWNMRYRFLDTEKKLSLGQYPAVSLSAARKRRDEARQMLAEGIDPSAAKRAKKEADKIQHLNTFERYAMEWHASMVPEWSETHADRLLTRLQQDVFPVFGKRPIASITTPEIIFLLERIAARSLETAHRIKAAISMIFRRACQRGIISYNPAGDLLRGAIPTVKHKHMAAPTDQKGATALLKAIDSFEGSFTVGIALKMLPHVFTRPGELRKAEWAEFDLEGRQWRIPAHKMKMKQAHIVPLSDQVMEMLKQLHPVTGNGKYLFPCRRSALNCMSENTINASLRRLGFEKDEITGHGFRALARTLLHETLGFSPDSIEAQLAHRVPDRLGTAYNRAQHLETRTKMMQVWSDYIDSLKTGAKVIPISKAA